ncbi:hypothetical protein [Muricoccus vinaceus]|uniref:Uncharacterized protein n=1 Tax=Muricoccus vinaceus TaxID=424704 RepID=A0ABV6IY29_9PROT
MLRLLNKLPVPAVVAIATTPPFRAWLILHRLSPLGRFLFPGDQPPPQRRAAFA